VSNKTVDICDRTFQFSVRVVRFCQEMGAHPGASRMIGTQLLRAGTSIGANVEEAQAGESRNDFIHKYGIALKEAREARYWLRLVGACNLAPQQEGLELQREAEELTRIIGAIIVSAKRKSPPLFSILSLLLSRFTP
jgi:four helix bundle protein